MRKYALAAMLFCLVQTSDAQVSAAEIDAAQLPNAPQNAKQDLVIQAGFFDPNAVLAYTRFSYYRSEKSGQQINLYHSAAPVAGEKIVTLTQSDIDYLNDLLIMAKNGSYDQSKGPLVKRIKVDSGYNDRLQYNTVYIDVQEKNFAGFTSYYFVLTQFSEFSDVIPKDSNKFRNTYKANNGRYNVQDIQKDTIKVSPEYNESGLFDIDLNETGLKQKIQNMIEVNRHRKNLQRVITRLQTRQNTSEETQFIQKVMQVQDLMYQNVEIAEQNALKKAVNEFINASTSGFSEKYSALKAIIETIPGKYDLKNARGAVERVDFVTHIHNDTSNGYTYRVTFVCDSGSDGITINIIPVYIFKRSQPATQQTK